ncbi:DUF2227 family putative metal-binding protein [Porifericola rhodea]|uniref:DUF2227 family putative metal-binding protein n=1 Tax=Porifericola rhodea TaxID=930972 RepID=UPI00266612BC|nr:DUF2227 family putative metal-binding protein [Porifericola rhodea]WKN33231.1 DUF2227 family putative metal-binding protein [Porifericola rhodea]
MASGKEHTLGTILLTPLTGLFAWHLSQGDQAITILASTGCLSGIFISPDLDMQTRTVSETTLVRWSWTIGYIWIFLWYPYALFFKHRGISHCPLVGTCTRLLYMVGYAFLLQEILRHTMDIEGHLMYWLKNHAITLSIFSAGLAISDIGHWFMDNF